jgi:ribosome-associated heat shock protein Hsp15
MRLDRFLWFARIVKKRDWAQALAETGHLRIDGRAATKAATPVRAGQVLAFARGGQVRAIRILALPARRGPPAEALSCYEDLLENVSQHAADD